MLASHMASVFLSMPATDTTFAGLLTETPAHSGHCTEFLLHCRFAFVAKTMVNVHRKKKSK